jgi:RNA polymerase sigma-70 factor (ECF subfamily)
VTEIASKAIGMTPFTEMGPLALAEQFAAMPLELEAIYLEHGRSVVRWVARLGGPNFDAEDAVQEVFAVVAERLSSFRGDSKITTWLYGITENVVRQQRRRERLRRWLFGGENGINLPSSDQVDAIERLQSNELVYRLLNRLREPYRSSLILFEIEGLSGEQIAELKHCKVATVWVWLHRARAQFLQQFNESAEQ